MQIQKYRRIEPNCEQQKRICSVCQEEIGNKTAVIHEETHPNHEECILGYINSKEQTVIECPNCQAKVSAEEIIKRKNRIKMAKFAFLILIVGGGVAKVSKLLHLKTFVIIPIGVFSGVWIVMQRINEVVEAMLLEIKNEKLVAVGSILTAGGIAAIGSGALLLLEKLV